MDCRRGYLYSLNVQAAQTNPIGLLHSFLFFMTTFTHTQVSKTREKKPIITSFVIIRPVLIIRPVIRTL
jgi:hypothetical protein